MSAQYKALLQWVAENVYAIHGVSSGAMPKTEIVEIEYALDDDGEHQRVIATGRGKTVWVAFIRALMKAREKHAMRAAINKMPRKFVKRFAETKINSNFYGKEMLNAPADKKDVPRRRRAKD